MDESPPQHVAAHQVGYTIAGFSGEPNVRYLIQHCLIASPACESARMVSPTREPRMTSDSDAPV